ncbi:p-hydroxycinnamoyl CoA hydratase/lyase [Propylenella binzhouense]|uniref:p-hydroxycinnamoyl CoA hydratase/lyase n=1 Tax=Propylenella binzhouense TaxID=2555902 RepID=A0A964WT24_9HYPH|nr:p-hydroxycinnamoyl CoA hydratase/lyase [Propylenella binzhouense]MYZ47569.1 p-hydroxycinnamoyl CoA hydratase/lyase [Propylenella binzhouense]
MQDYKYENVLVNIHDGIAWVTLNRPDKRNAMSPALHYDMDDALARLETDPDAAVIVITGAGGNFSAGQDLKKFFRELDSNPAEKKKAAEAANRWRWERIYNYRKPTIAMVHGYCVGGAFMQLLACDFAIAAKSATFSLSEVNWGILPGALVAKVVADALLPRHAMYYACLGDAFDGDEAARIGLVNYAVPDGELEKATEDLAVRLMKKSPEVLRATKQAMRHVRSMDFAQAYDYLAEKGKAIRANDKEDSYNTGLRQFLDEKIYKPTFEPFQRGTLLTHGAKKAEA